MENILEVLTSLIRHIFVFRVISNIFRDNPTSPSIVSITTNALTHLNMALHNFSVSQHNVSMSETNMGKLLDALETGDLRGKEKLEVHKKIAALAVRLGWL